MIIHVRIHAHNSSGRLVRIFPLNIRSIGIIAVIGLLFAACGLASAQREAAVSPASVRSDLIAPGMVATTAAALVYLRQREAIRSGEPVVRLAQPATPKSIRLMGLNIANWDPACARPMSLVIFEGDIDGRNLIVAPGVARGAQPARFVGFVFDRRHGDPGDIMATILSPDGGAFRTALGDESLPASDMTVPDAVPPFVPCEDVNAPGRSAPDASPTS